jgi:transposase
MPSEDTIPPPLEASKTTDHIFLSIEMSGAKWVIGAHTPVADKIAIHTITSGDVNALLILIDRLRSRVLAGDGSPAVICCYEAGYEGFWLHRRLSVLGITVVVIDPASLLINRRAKRAKTDRIDARDMIRP